MQPLRMIRIHFNVAENGDRSPINHCLAETGGLGVTHCVLAVGGQGVIQ